MSILQEVFLEEYDRCRRCKKAHQETLKEYPKGSERHKQLKKGIKRANKDMRMLRRALGPFVIFRWRRWKKRNIEYKLEMMQGNKE